MESQKCEKTINLQFLFIGIDVVIFCFKISIFLDFFEKSKGIPQYSLFSKGSSLIASKVDSDQGEWSFDDAL